MPLPGDCHKGDNYELLKVSAVFRFKEVDYSLLELAWHDNLLTIRAKGDRPGCVSAEEKPVVLMSVVDTDFMSYDISKVTIHVEGEHTVDGKRFPVEI